MSIKYRTAAVQAVLLIAGIALLIAGILHDEPAGIMRKAVVVCLECIGIG